ncbi:unnamed protein product [Ectocarpus sp. 4 AP-2014]
MRSVRATVWLLSLLSSLTTCHSFVAQPKLGLALRWRDCCRSTTCSVYGSSGSGSSGPGEVQATKKENGGSTASQESDMFEWLAANAGIRDKAVSLSVTAGGYRGLLADGDFAQGQASTAVVLEVPSDICLWSTRDGVVSGLYGQTDLCWEAAGDLRDPVSDEDFARGMTWDVRLALALLEATSDPQVGGKFWHVYGRLLPQPHTVTVPFCLPERLLGQLHNSGMAERARKQVERVRSLYPDLMQTLLSHPKTAVYAARKTAKGEVTAAAGEAATAAATREEAEKETDAVPMALLWAFAMVRSRAFAADGDRFAFVPFLDMANHGFADPAANFTYISGGESQTGVFQLQAIRNISAGEEVTISYGEQLNAEQLMVQYGFPAPPNVPLERPLCGSDALVRDAVAVAMEQGKETAGAATATAAAGEGVVGGGNAEGLPAAAAQEEEEERGSRGALSEAERVGLMNELFLRAQQRFAREVGGDERRFEIGVRKVLPLVPPIATKIGELMGDGEDGMIKGAELYLEELQAYRSENFPSTEEQDRELLSYCLGNGRGKVDPRLADVVRYRLGRKEAHSTAAGILEEFTAPAPPALSTPPAGDATDPPQEAQEEE